MFSRATSKQIKVKFNEDIQLLDGALIFCRPMGGSESYKSIEYYSAKSDNPIMPKETNCGLSTLARTYSMACAMR